MVYFSGTILFIAWSVAGNDRVQPPFLNRPVITCFVSAGVLDAPRPFFSDMALQLSPVFFRGPDACCRRLTSGSRGRNFHLALGCRLIFSGGASRLPKLHP